MHVTFVKQLTDLNAFGCRTAPLPQPTAAAATDCTTQAGVPLCLNKALGELQHAMCNTATGGLHCLASCGNACLQDSSTTPGTDALLLLAAAPRVTYMVWWAGNEPAVARSFVGQSMHLDYWLPAPASCRTAALVSWLLLGSEE